MEHDGFLSYRVWCDKDIAEKLFYALSAKGLRIFWDRQCLSPGAPWEDSFVAGLHKSKIMIIMISEKALEGMADKALAVQDNQLKEIELAVDKMVDGASKYVLPLLIGEYRDLDAVRVLKKFSSFGGLPDKPWPEQFSTTCQTRTIKQTMDALFAVQGIFIDPDDISPSLELIHAALLANSPEPCTVLGAPLISPSQSLYGEASDHSERGDHEKAAELFMEAHKGGGLSEEQKETAMKCCAGSWFAAAKWQHAASNFMRARECAEKARKIGRGLSSKEKQQARHLEGECRVVERADLFPKFANFTETITQDSDDAQMSEVYNRGRMLMRQANYADAEQLFNDALKSHPRITIRERFKLEKHKKVCHALMSTTIARDALAKFDWHDDEHVDGVLSWIGAAAVGAAATGAVVASGAAVGAAVGGVFVAGAFALVISRNFLTVGEGSEQRQFVQQVKQDISAATGEPASRFDVHSLEPGSVIMYISVSNAASSQTPAVVVYHNILAQIDDQSSKLYQGSITCDIDATKTKTLSATIQGSGATTTTDMMTGDAVTALWTTASSTDGTTSMAYTRQPKDILRSVLNVAFDTNPTLAKSELKSIFGQLYDEELALHGGIDKLLAVASQALTLTLMSKSVSQSEKVVGTETGHLDGFAADVKGDLELLSAEEMQGLEWEGDGAFRKAPWQREGVRMFRSVKFNEYVNQALQHVVQGEGMGMTQKELIEEIRIGTGLPVWIFGGFVRDAVQGKSGNDMDLKFITDRVGMKKIAQFGKQKGWMCSALTRHQENEGRDPKYNYVRFGDAEKRDIEGKCAENTYTDLVGWGAAEFACNDLLYSPEHQVIVDLTGVGVQDAEHKLLRIPFWRFLAEDSSSYNEKWQLAQWQRAEGAGGIYRWLKFRHMRYTPADDEVRVFMVKHIAGYLQSKEGFVELMTTLAAKAVINDQQDNLLQAETVERFQQWGLVMKRDLGLLPMLSTSVSRFNSEQKTRLFESGSEVVLWKHGEDAIACTVEGTLGEGAHGVVLRVQYAGRTCALKVKKFDQESKEAAVRQFLRLCEEAAVSVDLNYPHSHPHVVGMDFVCSRQDTQELLFLMEFVENSEDLKAMMSSGKLYSGSRDEVSRRLTIIAYQLALSLKFAHSKGVLHQDIKPENVLYDKEKKMAKLADFGVSSRVKLTVDSEGGSLLQASFRGCTKSFASSNVNHLFTKLQAASSTKDRDELCEKHQLSHFDDIWSFAVTIIDLFAGGSSWRMGLPAYMVWIHKLDILCTEYSRSTMPQGLAEVLTDCLDQVYELTMDQIVQRIAKVIDMQDEQPLDLILGEGLGDRRANIIHNNLGLAFHSKQQLGKAADHYREALSAVDDDPRAQNNLGVALQAMGMIEEASKHYKKAHEIDPKHPFAEANLGSLMRAHQMLPGGIIPDGVLDTSGIESELAGEATTSSIVSKHAVMYGQGQRLQVYREQTAKWEECEVVNFHKMNGVHDVIFDGETEASSIEDLGLTVHHVVPNCHEQLLVGQTVQLHDKNDRPTGRQAVISRFG
jgi:serine/threonine protein kinase